MMTRAEQLLIEMAQRAMNEKMKPIHEGQSRAGYYCRNLYIGDVEAIKDYFSDKVMCISNDEGYGMEQSQLNYIRATTVQRKQLCPILHYLAIPGTAEFLMVTPFASKVTATEALEKLTIERADPDWLRQHLTYIDDHFKVIDESIPGTEEYNLSLLMVSGIRIGGHLIADLSLDNIGRIDGNKYKTNDIVVFDYAGMD